MSVFDGNDLEAIKELIEVAVEDVIETKELATKSDISHLPTKLSFMERWMKL